MSTRKIILTAGIIVALMLLSVVIYNVYDNQRFIVVEQEFIIDRLPDSFNGFRILQISDLHGKYFGKNQADLIEQINALEFDMIALTGDMNDSRVDSTPENSHAIITLLEGIENNQHIYWVDGNTGPYALRNMTGANTGELTEVGSVLNEIGVKPLLFPYEIIRGDQRIWITPELSEMVFEASYRSRTQIESLRQDEETEEKIQTYYKKIYRNYQTILDNGEVKIMLTHVPKQVNLTQAELEMIKDLDYDLILAGHYHGGQIRLPFVGAIYIPSPVAGFKNLGIFPPQNVVRGISYYGNTPQYVSAGLGASGHIRILQFRLFNTPEINLITLRNSSD